MAFIIIGICIVWDSVKLENNKMTKRNADLAKYKTKPRKKKDRGGN